MDGGHVDGGTRGRWDTWRVGGGVMLIECVYRGEDDRRERGVGGGECVMMYI